MAQVPATTLPPAHRSTSAKRMVPGGPRCGTVHMSRPPVRNGPPQTFPAIRRSNRGAECRRPTADGESSRERGVSRGSADAVLAAGGVKQRGKIPASAILPRHRAVTSGSAVERAKTSPTPGREPSHGPLRCDETAAASDRSPAESGGATLQSFYHLEDVGITRHHRHPGDWRRERIPEGTPAAPARRISRCHPFSRSAEPNEDPSAEASARNPRDQVAKANQRNC